MTAALSLGKKKNNLQPTWSLPGRGIPQPQQGAPSQSLPSSGGRTGEFLQGYSDNGEPIYGFAAIEAKKKKDAATATSSSNAASSQSYQQLLDQAKKAEQEARTKTEASKTSALGYYKDASGKMVKREADMGSLFNKGMGTYEGLMNELKGISGDLITPQQKQQMMATRQDALASGGQNLTAAFSDPDSGIQSGRRLGIAQDVAARAANLPIQTELEVGQANRGALMDLMGKKTALAGDINSTIANRSGNLLNLSGQDLNLAGGQAGLQTAYEYDPGSGYSQAAGQALGNMGTTGTEVGTGTAGTTGSTGIKVTPTPKPTQPTVAPSRTPIPGAGLKTNPTPGSPTMPIQIPAPSQAPIGGGLNVPYARTMQTSNLQTKKKPINSLFPTRGF